MRFGLIELTQPETEPVTLEGAKSHCRVDIDDADSLISSWIKAAREWCEEYTERAFITRSVKLVMDRFPSRYDRVAISRGDGLIRLPRPRLVAVTAFTYLGHGGASQTLSADDFQVDGISEPARLAPLPGYVWPTARYGALNAVAVTYSAGYGASANDVPASIKAAILLIVGHLHETREATIEAALAEVPMGVKSLLYPYCLGEQR